MIINLNEIRMAVLKFQRWTVKLKRGHTILVNRTKQPYEIRSQK